MAMSQYSLSWDGFQSSMCAGFSSLQQNEELVDLTLAAEGHLVKVHQIVLGIASPYLKELIKSANCKHPVIFMHNMSYDTLCNLLEYIYTGEVSIEENDLTAFLEIAKTFKIKGLEGMGSKEKKYSPEKIDTNLTTEVTPVRKFQIEILADKSSKLTEEVQLPTSARNIHVKHKNASLSLSGAAANKPTIKSGTSQKTSAAETDSMDQDDHFGQDFGYGDDVSSDDEVLKLPSKGNDGGKSQQPDLNYTVSNRGALQLILNRYLYNLHSRKPSRVKRWGCVDYRYRKCPAVVFTENNVVIRRIKMHNHAFHDRRINSKVVRKAVYSAFEAADVSRREEK